MNIVLSQETSPDKSGRSHKQILYIPFIDDWSLGYALLEVFPIRPAVLPFQGVGT